MWLLQNKCAFVEINNTVTHDRVAPPSPLPNTCSLCDQTRVNRLFKLNFTLHLRCAQWACSNGQGEKKALELCMMKISSHHILPGTVKRPNFQEQGRKQEENI